MKKIPETLKILKFSIILVATTSSTLVFGDKPSPHRLVEEVAETFVRENLSPVSGSTVTIEVNEIDERIDIPSCPLPLETSTSSSFNQSNITVKVSCPSNDWFLYTMVKVDEVQPVVVPSSALSPGSILTTANLEVININKNRLRSTTYATKEELVGARLKRRSRPGNPITPNMLCFVCKGDPIVIVAEVSGMKIKTTGIAEQDGNIGDTILVKNKRSNKRIDAKVITTSLVKVHI